MITGYPDLSRMKPAMSAISPSAGRWSQLRPTQSSGKSVAPDMGEVCANPGILPASKTPYASPTKPVCADVAIRVSVIVPVYNNPDQLSRCLLALRTATGADTELIVVDDASTDDVSSTAAHFGTRFLRLTRNAGPAAARNHGARYARGQILFFVDADVVVPNDAIGRIQTLLDRHGEIAAVFGSYDACPPAPGLVSRYRNL